MALHCAHCNGTDLSHLTETAGCLSCHGQTNYDGTAGPPPPLEGDEKKGKK